MNNTAVDSLNLKIKKKKKRQIGLNLCLIILCLIVVAPFWLVVSVSLSSEADILEFGYRFIPKNIDFSAYKYVFSDPKDVINAYKVTIFHSVVTTLGSLLLQSMFAYPLSRKIFKERRALSFILYFTMMFSGGLVPTYLLYTQYLHLDDTIWIYLLPGLVSAWNVFMIRTYFAGIPGEIVESAYMDGASEFRIFFTFMLPLSTPVLATLGINTFLACWNDWNTSMLYINKPELIQLQYLLQRILLNIQMLQSADSQEALSLMNMEEIPAETVRMAMAVVVAGPALLIFPFFQKYFVKGMVVGSVKG